MASPTPFRALVRRSPPRSTRALTPARPFSTRGPRLLASLPAEYRDAEVEPTASAAADGSRPRWAQTPPAMRAPFRTRPDTKCTRWEVNADPRRLDEAYERLLGPGGERLLTEETKWLAVTHKSFDHGRRGFNDKLAFLGKRIVDLQTSLALLSAPKPDVAVVHDPYHRQQFNHPALQGLPNLSSDAKAEVTHKTRLARLAESKGLRRVLRWQPRNVDNLQGSGIDAILAHTMYAIVGAIALERGGEVANKTVRDKILAPLGLA
ncbi:RNase III domain protein [Lineolata rhizophorae]|uniref:RNase III domain protein n=1 Tax=Lineolata rhizophorae TaxID=578093 RepID=A0A6A6NVW3_9PEZI|nr:RNase III domain protein [Lineolata rhizophorae]